MRKKIIPYGGFCFAILNSWWMVHCQRFPYIFQHVAAVGDMSGCFLFIWLNLNGASGLTFGQILGSKNGPMRRVRF